MQHTVSTHFMPPYQHARKNTGRIMVTVLMAMLPAVVVSIFFFGVAVLFQLVWCAWIALTTEAIILRLRKRPVLLFLKDGSALLTATLLALALPPISPWWLSAVGVIFAVGIGKQLYGGLGHNPFNPAMLGYVVLLICFPRQMSQWMAPAYLSEQLPTFFESLANLLPLMPTPDPAIVDSWTMATPLELVRNNTTLTQQELWQSYPQLQGVGGWPWVLLNFAWIAGGLFLLHRKIISWHAPVGMMVSLTMMSLIFWQGSGSQSNGSPLFHLLSGATMMGAFFIITDPVSGATSNKGRLISGWIAGILTYVIRVWGAYPDAVAFATLLMNLCAPMLDYYTKPSIMGHNRGSTQDASRIKGNDEG